MILLGKSLTAIFGGGDGAPAVAAAANAGVGKINAWPDPFFRDIDLATASTNYLGKPRWWGGTTGWSVVNNAVYDGNALRRAGAASGFSGVIIDLAEISAGVGDKITLYIMLVGSGSTVSVYGRGFDAVAGSWTEAQVQGVDALGNVGLITSTNPTWRRLEFIVTSASTKKLAIYFTHTGATDWDIVALWGAKGGIADVPQAPINLVEFQRAAIETAADALTDAKISTLEAAGELTDAKISTLEATEDYLISKETTLSYTVATTAIDGTGFGIGVRDLPFVGWAEKFTPNGVSFNAVKIAQIAQPATANPAWGELRVVVRTGANSQNANSTVVAVGTAFVTPIAIGSSNMLYDTIIALRDPASGAVKTLTNADFVGGEYFIGVYALSATGAWSACGEPRGTIPNAAGQSYYLASSTSLTNIPSAAWLTNFGNSRMGFVHLLLTNPVETVLHTPSSGLVRDVGNAISSAVPTVVLPPVIYATSGVECNVYTANSLLQDLSDYNVGINATAGIQQVERYTYTPSAALTSGTLVLTVYDKNTGNTLTSKTSQLRAAASTAGSGLNKKLLVIGDSLINAGYITQTLLDLATPDPMDLTLLGTRGSGLNKHEGRGGYVINDYATVGRTYYSFTVSGVTTAPAINSTKYSAGGSVFTVQELVLNGGTGTFICSLDSGSAPPASGTLTKTFGTGDATVTYSASASVSGNPFWFSGAVNFGQYLTDRGLATPDYVIIALGINDAFWYTADTSVDVGAGVVFAKLDTLLASIRAVSTSIRIGLAPPPPPASQDGFGASYAAGVESWRDRRNAILWAKALIDKYGIPAQVANNVFVLSSNVALDTVRGYPYQVVNASSRTTQTVIRHTNGVHPDVPGYQQIADSWWAFIKCKEAGL